MMLSEADQRHICQVLRAYIEEWGMEYTIVVQVPKQWEKHGDRHKIGVARFEFVTEDEVAICVEGIELRHAVKLGARQD